MDPQSQPAPFICRFNAFTPEQKIRYRELREWLHASTRELLEMENGFAFGLEPNAENVQRLAEFTFLEGICCPFLEFALRIGEDHSSLRLELTGREGVKPFLAAELDLKI